MQAIRDALTSVLGDGGLHIYTSLNLGLTSLLFFIFYIGALLYTVNRGRKGLKIPKIRRIAGLDSIEEVIGRATEMGRPVIYLPGQNAFSAATFAALGILGHVGQVSARYDARLIVCCGQSNVYPVLRSTVSQAYTEAGKPDAYREEDVRFLTTDQFGFASGVNGIINREKVVGQLMFGGFAAESIVFAETGSTLGCIQVAGTPDILQIPFFITSCDYTLLGEELFAASAYLTRDNARTSTLVAQDWGRQFAVVLIILGIITATVASFTGAPTHFIAELLQLY